MIIDIDKLERQGLFDSFFNDLLDALDDSDKNILTDLENLIIKRFNNEVDSSTGKIKWDDTLLSKKFGSKIYVETGTLISSIKVFINSNDDYEVFAKGVDPNKGRKNGTSFFSNGRELARHLNSLREFMGIPVEVEDIETKNDFIFAREVIDKYNKIMKRSRNARR